MRATKQRVIFYALILAGGFGVATGCTMQPAHWAVATDVLSVSAMELNELRITTHNGGITVTGDDTVGDDIQVTVKRRGGGATVESAEKCLEAIEIVSETAGDGAHQLGWRLDGLKKIDWRIEVGFKVTMPSRLAVRTTTHNGAVKIAGVGSGFVTTHNGAVEVEDVAGACDVVTHNGGVKVATTGSPVRARTHNGGILAACASGNVQLSTHNGGITLDARDASQLSGGVHTHNGGVRVKIGDAMSATFDCSTHNGGIHCGSCQETRRDKRSATCVAGSGEQRVWITTHNGGIHIEG